MWSPQAQSRYRSRLPSVENLYRTVHYNSEFLSLSSEAMRNARWRDAALPCRPWPGERSWRVREIVHCPGIITLRFSPGGEGDVVPGAQIDALAVLAPPAAAPPGVQIEPRLAVTPSSPADVVTRGPYSFM